jgi:prepilin-type N-terminal cleavage/methylation domain-containing protein
MAMTRRPHTRRAGFTLLEMTIAVLLMGIMAALLAAAWPSFYRGATDVASRAQLAREADFALSQIAKDLTGVEWDGDTPPHPRRRHLVKVEVDDGDTNGEVFFKLHFDSDPGDGAPGGPDDKIVAFRMDADARTLSRDPDWSETDSPGDAEPIARHVAGFRVRRLLDPINGNPLTPWIIVELNLEHPVEGLVARRLIGKARRTFTLIACVP